MGKLWNILQAWVTDVCITKNINQDNLCKNIRTNTVRATFIFFWDGMGGFSRGELASNEVTSSFAHWFNSQLPFMIPQWGCHSATHKVISRLNSKFVDFGRCECMKLEITAIGIIAVDSQFIIFHVWDIFIYKVLDKLIDFKNGELYDMLLLLQSRKKSCWSVLTVKNNFGIHHSKHHPVITKKERRSDLIAEISASIKKNT